LVAEGFGDKDIANRLVLSQHTVHRHVANSYLRLGCSSRAAAVAHASRHEVVADEIARVLRPGGRVGFCAWTPEGSIGDFFRAVGNYLPPPPEFVSPPLRWGDEQYVRELFEGTGLAIEFERKVSDIHHHSVADAVECYATKFGPVVKARALLDADSRWTELRDDMIKLFQRHNTSGGTRVVLPAQYLVVLGRKAP
jgi:SAM-dependent methyltransferase